MTPKTVEAGKQQPSCKQVAGVKLPVRTDPAGQSGSHKASEMLAELKLPGTRALPGSAQHRDLNPVLGNDF